MEPHEVDVIALALIAVGIFLGGVAYFGWAGGSVGHGSVGALRFLVGALAYAVPVVLVIAGGLILARELRPPARPLRTGAICLTAALSLALAAGTLGVGPGAEPAQHFWSAATIKPRGGILGAVEFWVAGHMFSTAGADILAVFLDAHRDPAPQRRNLRLGRAGRPAQRRRRTAPSRDRPGDAAGHNPGRA